MRVGSIYPLLMGLFLCCAAPAARAQEPLYIVNGEVRDQIATIDPEQIEQIEQLPANEESIARFGPEAGNGVVVVTLKFDRAPRFQHPEGWSLAEYVTQAIEWVESDPTARIAIRYRILADGGLEVDKILEATDKRLLRRVLRALEQAPRWEPAQRQGRAVQSEGHLLRLTLPEGRELPPERYIVIR